MSARRLPAAGSDRRRWLVSFAVLSALMGGWAVASPLFSSPDEPAHVAKAAGAARGQFLGRPVRGDPLLRTFRAPAVFATGHAVPDCYKFKPDVGAACAPAFGGLRRTGDVVTHVGNYPPLYYTLVGLPTLVAPSAAGVYLMRLVSVALSAAFLAWALVCAARWRSPILLAGVAAATTPMVLYFGASVNPNSLEMSTAICLWVSGLMLLVPAEAERRAKGEDDVGDDGHDEHEPTRVGQIDTMLVAAAGLSAAVLVSMRTLSPLLLGLIGLFLLGLTSRRRLADLVGRRDVRMWLAVGAVAAAIAVVWLIVHDTIQLPRVDEFRDLPATTAARNSLGKTDGDIRQMVGVFGWLDTPSPALTFYLWFFATGTLIVFGLVAASRRLLMGLLAVIAATVVVPRLLEFPSVQKYGFGWQGRYGLPLAVGVPLLAAFAVGSRPEMLGAWSAKVTRVVIALLGVAHVAVFVVVLRRYMVGVNGPLDFLDGPWQPPVAPIVLLVGFSLAVVAWAWWLGRLAASRPASVVVASGP
ncbi:MAG TPA: DUF2142 domain-containing protein [Acidimicrobiales bacterium]|nr:DUF2142 domain-containing protein [Acidimicrobiales bacterium]